MKEESIQKQVNHQEKITGIIQSLENISLIQKNPILHDELIHLKNRAQDQFFKVAVVGEFSSGKSTFINALIQKDLLKHGAKETTATLTKVINVDKKHKYHGKCKVVFQNGTEKIVDNMEEITAYTTTSSERHLVSQEVSSFEIYMHFLNTEVPMMIIDTPGLNGMAENHREQTIQQLKEAHACIYLMQLRGLSQSDIDFIRFISSYQHDFIFLQNFIDELKELEGETIESKLKKQEEIIKSSVFQGQESVRYSLCGISSRQALIAQDRTYSYSHEYGEGPLDEIARRKMLRASNFEGVMEILSKLMKDNHKGLIQQRSIMENLIKFLEYTTNLLHIEDRTLSALWQESDEAKIIQKTSIVRDRLLLQKSEHIKKLEHFVHAKVHELSHVTRKKIEQDLQDLERDINSKIKGLESVDIMDDFIEKHEIEHYFSKKIPSVELSYTSFLENGFHEILSNAVLRIQDYTGVSKALGAVPRFKVKSLNRKTVSFVHDEDNLKNINKKIAEELAAQRKTNLEILRLEADKKKDIQAIQMKQEETERLKRELEQKEMKLGIEPKKEYKTVEKTVYESHRNSHKFVGFILDKLVGDKKTVVPDTVEDNSKRNQWNNKKRILNQQYQQKMEDLKNQQEELEIRIQGYQTKTSSLEKSNEIKSRRVENFQDLYSKMKSSLEVKKKEAATEYMNLVKKSLYSRIYEYLYEEENIKAYFDEHVSEYVKPNREVLMEKVRKFYEAAFEYRLKGYEEILKGMSEQGKPDVTQDIDMINKYKKELEEYLCQIS